MTAYHEQYSVAEALEIGFAAYLPKPLDLYGLCLVIRFVLGDRRPGTEGAG